MANWADRAEAAWLDASLAAALVSGLAALAMIQCRQPARRRVWGRLGLVGCLLVIPLVAVAPLPRLDLRHPTRSLWVVEHRPRSGAHRPAEVAGRAPREDAGEPVAAPRTSGRDGSAWPAAIRRWLAVAYGAGLLFGLGRLGLGLAGTWYLLRVASRPSPRALALFESLPSTLAVARRPRLLISRRTGRPVLVGGGKGAILIPPHLDDPAAAPQLRLGALHELAHAEVADPQFGLVAELANAIWFPLPQVWWIQSQLRLDAEFLADHRAVGHFGTSRGYAESLVGLALPPSPAPSPSPADRAGAGAGVAAAGGRPGRPAPPRRTGGLASALFQRVQMLLKCPFEVEEAPPRSWTLGVGLVALVAVMLASCLTTRDGDEPASPIGPSIAEASRIFHLAELSIAPQLVDDRPFDLRFRLPDRFRFACEVLAEPAELAQIEILGYHLGTAGRAPEGKGDGDRPAWRRVEIVRGPGGREAVHVDGVRVEDTRQPAETAAWLTIRPASGRTTRFRDLYLTY